MSRVLFVSIAVFAGIGLGALVWPEFVDFPSLGLTLGGAVTVTLVSYSKKQWIHLICAIRSLFMEKQQNLQAHVDELSRLTRLFRLKGVRGLESQEGYLADPFLKQAVGLLVDLRNEEEIRTRLQQLLAAFLGEQETSRQILNHMGKLLPAFGLIGTLIGMVLLLRNVSAQQLHALPAALSMAVLTTLYGALFANVIVAPLAARLQAVAVEKELMMRLTVRWILALLSGSAVIEIENRLQALRSVPPDEANQGHGWNPAILPAQR